MNPERLPAVLRRASNLGTPEIMLLLFLLFADPVGVTGLTRALAPRRPALEKA